MKAVNSGLSGSGGQEVDTTSVHLQCLLPKYISTINSTLLGIGYLRSPRTPLHPHGHRGLYLYTVILTTINLLINENKSPPFKFNQTRIVTGLHEHREK